MRQRFDVIGVIGHRRHRVQQSAEAAQDIDGGIAQRLDAAIDQAMTAASIPGAIIGIWGPEGRYVRAVGVADKATGAPMKADFYSRIGSMTKTFTVTAILQLAEQGKLGLDDPIGKYIDGVPQGDKITLRQLARMRSGLENYAKTPGFQQALVADPYRNFTPQELLGYAFAAPMPFPPGEAFEYSNTNTVLLGLVVEKVSGQSLPDYIKRPYPDPAGHGPHEFSHHKRLSGAARAGLYQHDCRRRGDHSHGLEPVVGMGGRRDDLNVG